MTEKLISLILALPGICGFAGVDFYHTEKRAEGWTVVDSSGRAELLLGVDQVKWDGMPCERMGWRRPYEEHNAAHYASRKEWEDETLSRQTKQGFSTPCAKRGKTIAPGARHVPPSPMGARAVVAHE